MLIMKEEEKLITRLDKRISELIKNESRNNCK